MDFLTSLGLRIRLLREKNNLTQDELAIKAGYTSRSSINKIESGLVDIPQTKIYAIASVFNVSPAYLMGWEENAPEQNELSEGEKVWLSLYNKVGEETREILITLANSVDEMPDESRRLFLSILRGALGSQEEGQKR